MFSWSKNEDGTCNIIDDGKIIGTIFGEHADEDAMSIVYFVNKGVEEYVNYINTSLHVCCLNLLADGTCSVCGKKYYDKS